MPLNLQEEGEEDLFRRIDWAVQEDPEPSGTGPASVKVYSEAC